MLFKTKPSGTLIRQLEGGDSAHTRVPAHHRRSKFGEGALGHVLKGSQQHLLLVWPPNPPNASATTSCWECGPLPVPPPLLHPPPPPLPAAGPPEPPLVLLPPLLRVLRLKGDSRAALMAAAVWGDTLPLSALPAARCAETCLWTGLEGGTCAATSCCPSQSGPAGAAAPALAAAAAAYNPA